jgi:hypothetical protein
MANKIVKSEIFEINISSLNKAQKIIYNKVSNKYRFCEIYDLTYSERLFVNDIFENATKEDLEVLKNIYFIDMKEIKEIFLTSPYSDDKIFLEILKEYKCK